MPESQHVAVLPFPFASHPSSLFTFVRMLASAAPDVRFSFISTPSSNSSIFKGKYSEGFGNIKPHNVWDGLSQDYVLSTDQSERINYFLGAAPSNFKEGIHNAVADLGIKVTCLLTDAFLWFGADIAEEWQVPWIPVWSASASSLSVHIHTDLLRKIINVIEETRSDNMMKPLDFIPGLTGIRVMDIPNGVVVGGDLEAGPVSRMLHYMGRMLPRASAVVLNSFEELEPIIIDDLKSKLKMMLNVGFYTLLSPVPAGSDDMGCLDWLDKQESSSVAYISFGSVIVPPPQEIIALAEALEESGVSFLWSFRGNAGELLPKGFMERTGNRGKLISWAPQLEILAHSSIGAFLTHGGWNSLTEAIIGGVPIICRPFFGDQKMNTRLIENVWGIGIGVEDDVITKDGLLRTLETVFRKHGGKEMRSKIQELKDVAVKATKPDGTSSQNFNKLLEVVVGKSKGEYH